MPRRVYNAEFKKSAIALVLEQNRSSDEVARSLGINPSTLRSWLKRYGSPGKLIDPVEDADLRRQNAELRREVTRLRMERDILKKATAFFAKETQS